MRRQRFPIHRSASASALAARSPPMRLAEAVALGLRRRELSEGASSSSVQSDVLATRLARRAIAFAGVRRTAGPVLSMMLGLVTAALCGSLQPALAADCAALLSDFDRAATARSLPDVQRLAMEIGDRSACSESWDAVTSRRVALDLDVGGDTGRERTEREAALRDASRSKAWRPAAELGDLLLEDRHYGEAAAAFDQAIDRAAREGAASADERTRLLKQAGAAKLLASDDREGTRAAALHRTARSAGGLGGIYAPGLRGPVPIAVPIPIQFAGGSSELTETGRQAADELLQALGEQKVSTLKLAGHTDPRGSDAYNMQLATRRLGSVQAYLLARNPDLKIALIPRGKRDPFDVTVLPYRPSQEEVWALDRRVEWITGKAE